MSASAHPGRKLSDIIVRWGAWRVCAVSVAMSVAFGAAMSLVWHGRVTLDYVVTSAIIAAIVSSVVLSVVYSYQARLEKTSRSLEETNHQLMRETEEREVSEKRLLITERVSTLGTMAAGIAHEINNPLTVVINNLEYALEQPELRNVDSDGIQAVRDALQGGERVAAIVAELKHFTRADESARRPVDVNVLLRTSIAMVENQLRSRASLDVDEGEDVWAMGDEGRLIQVFVNLLLNAAQACDDERTQRHRISVRSERGADDTIQVVVSDTGVGIPPENRTKVFDPFFTTKHVGVGTGLGLSISHSIISALGGRIEIGAARAPDERGTSMVVILPAASPLATQNTDAASRAPPLGKRQRVLVIDDDPGVVRVLERILDDCDMVVADSGARGLAEMTPNGFDLIFCDLMMPDISGIDVHRAATAEQRARMVFMTGGTFTPAAREFCRDASIHCLEKPFRKEEVRALLSDVGEPRSGTRVVEHAASGATQGSTQRMSK